MTIEQLKTEIEKHRKDPRKYEVKEGGDELQAYINLLNEYILALEIENEQLGARVEKMDDYLSHLPIDWEEDDE